MIEAEITADRDRMASVIEHLVQNAQEATPEMGQVKVRLRASKENTQIEIEDNGCGMEAKFIRERLFKPFETTKGNAGMGIGVYESREFVRSLDGVIDVDSTPNLGTRFTITLPNAQRCRSG